MNTLYVEFCVEAPRLFILSSIPSPSSLPLSTSVHFLAISSTNEWLLRRVDLRQGIGMDVSIITLATISTYVGSTIN